MTKVDLTTWKSHPLGGNLFAAELETIARTTIINQFEAANERIMGGDANETWYAPLLEPEYSHNWMHLLQPSIYLKKEELVWFKMRVFQRVP